MKIKILYEDNHIIGIEKPVNIPVQEDRSKDPDLLSIVKNDIKVRYKKPGNVYVGLVHRLDRPVGGAMIFAKTSKAASRLADALRRQAIERTYVAVVHGTPHKRKGRITDYLLKDPRTNITSIVSEKVPNAKKAILEYEVIGEKEGFSLLSVRLQTGRSHQIRVQLAGIGCPLYGDQKYGQHVNRPGEQIALWSQTLQFIHSVTKEQIKVISSPPSVYPWNVFNSNKY